MKMNVKIATLHQATMIHGAYVSEKTLNKIKLPTAEMYRIPGDGLYIVIKDKQTLQTMIQSVPDAGVANYLYEDVEVVHVDDKKRTAKQ